jgi:hypothetical protein
MNYQEIIKQLKEYLEAINFEIIMEQWERHRDDFFIELPVAQRYKQGADIIMKVIDAGLYLKTDREFFTILEDILGSISNVNLHTYRMALYYRYEKLNRRVKTHKELDIYIAYL